MIKKMIVQMPTTPKKEIGGLLLLTLLLIPLLLSAAAVNLAIAESQLLPLAKLLSYSSILMVVTTLLTILTMLIRKKVELRLAMTKLLLPSFLTLVPVALAATSIKHINTPLEIIINTGNQSSVLEKLRALGGSYYIMNSTKKEKFVKTAEEIQLGTTYLKTIKIFPPIPDGAPVIVKDLENKGILLKYYLEKRFEGDKSSRSDKHISLTFDDKKQLVEIERSL